MSFGADVNAKDETGKPPIFYAIENADLKFTKLLLTNKANIKDNPVLSNVTVPNDCTEIVEFSTLCLTTSRCYHMSVLRKYLVT
jgi:ankyrin repeat protein